MLTHEERNAAFVAIIPDVWVELMSETDSLPEALEKIQTVIRAGVKEAALIDTKNNLQYLFNHPNVEPQVDPLSSIEFDAMPGFELDCLAIKEIRQDTL